MSLQAREAVTAGGDNVVQRRRVVRRPPFPGTVRRGGEAEAQADFLNELTASEPATLLQSFVGANFAQTGSLPPDPSGAAGPAQFILAANGRIRSFSKATATADQVLNLTTNAFFTSVRAGANTFGPKIKYDRLAGRWFIIAATDAVPGRIVIASSNASTITAGTLWSFFAFDNTGFPGPPHAPWTRRHSASTRMRSISASCSSAIREGSTWAPPDTSSARRRSSTLPQSR